MSTAAVRYKNENGLAQVLTESAPHVLRKSLRIDVASFKKLNMDNLEICSMTIPLDGFKCPIIALRPDPNVLASYYMRKENGNYRAEIFCSAPDSPFARCFAPSFGAIQVYVFDQWSGNSTTNVGARAYNLRGEKVFDTGWYYLTIVDVWKPPTGFDIREPATTSHLISPVPSPAITLSGPKVWFSDELSRPRGQGYDFLDAFTYHSDTMRYGLTPYQYDYVNSTLSSLAADPSAMGGRTFVISEGTPGLMLIETRHLPDNYG